MMLPSGRRRNPGRLGFWRRCSGCLSPLLNRLFVSWEFKALNDSLFTWGVRYSRYLKLWFSLGVGVGFFLMVTIVFSMLLWVSTLLMGLGKKTIASGSAQQSMQVLTVVIPGVNVPWSDLPFMILATAFALGFHELGHGMAAASEGVAIEHVAVFLACIVPGALIALNQESLQLLSPIQALRIYCAGIWHNVMFCAGCYLSLMLLPMVLYPFYVWNQYPMISNIDAKSPLARHLNHGDSILKVAGHQLQSPEDWFEVLHNRSIQEELAQLNHTSIAHVIVELSQKASYHVALQGFCVCSENFTKHQNRLLGSMCPDDALLFYQHSCASAMPSSIKTSQNIYCSKATDVVKCPACRLEKNSEVTPCSGCSESTSCLFPLLSHGEVFVEIEVQKLRCSVNPADPYCEHNLVFVGNLRDLFHSLQLTKYWPRQGGLFGLFSVSFSVSIPKFFERLLMYTFSISAAMALMNSAPVFYLDGELVLEAWFQNSKSWVHPKKHKQIMQIVLTGGTALVAFFFIFEFIRTCS